VGWIFGGEVGYGVVPEAGEGLGERTKANRAFQLAYTTRAQNASNFNAWYSAYLARNKGAERVAEKRFRPNYDVAFLAWLATKPDVSPPTGTHPSTSTKKNVKAPGPASGSYVSNQQQQLQDKGGQ
jgi:hypothetical protein